MGESHAAALSRIYSDLRTRMVSDRALAVAKLGFTDCIGCIIAGSAEPASIAIREFAGDLGEGRGPTAAVLGTTECLPPALAALVNGTAGHVLDYDDMNSTMIGHPSVVLVPAIFAVGEVHGRTGAEVLNAYVTGFEVDTYFARILVPRHYNAGWHSTSSIGVFGAAAASARLLGLDEAGALNALAIAASSSAGLRGNFGSMTKSLHAGQAAESGVRAAMLSLRGFTANAGIFDEAGGYFDAYARNTEPKAWPTEGALEVETSGLGIKPYACCGAGVSVVDAALDLRSVHQPDAGEIQGIECRVTTRANSIMPFRAALDGLQAKYCIEYCTAVALLDGGAGLAQFEDERVRGTDVALLAKRVKVVVDDKLNFDANRFQVRLHVTMRDGRTLSSAVDVPRGHFERPLTEEQQRQKFLECTAPTFGQERAGAAFVRLQALEDQESLQPIIEELSP